MLRADAQRTSIARPPALFLLALTLFACAPEATGEADPLVPPVLDAGVDAAAVELYGPAPPPPWAPEVNPTTSAKVELGRHLFYDPRLSRNENVSCASCHHQERAFSDGEAVSEGTTGELTSRNSQSLVNVAYAATLTWANSILSDLERQALVPLFGDDPIELGMSGREALLFERFAREPRYGPLFAAAFPEAKEDLRVVHVVRALAAFQRALVSLRSPYDRYVAGDENALGPSAIRGLSLFESERLGCKGCHGGPFFSSAFDFPTSERPLPEPRFEQNGLYATYPIRNRGLFELTGNPEDLGRFRPPSLRNVGVTGPYMHDGSLATLEEVIAHYERGGAEGAPRSELVREFTLTRQERDDLIAFLESLTDEVILTDPALSDPWRDPE